ncbi:MAG: hypothetical protein CMG64_06895 [Candidatus Marinimicrobia bacterium]|nr:hypothetical protein [Candidatus Neomarinimicrobiota bacterium]
MISPIKIEKILLIGILFGFLLPLSTGLPLFKLAAWNIPAGIILFIILLRGVFRNRFRIKSFDSWDYSIVGISIIYLVMTLLGREFLLNLSNLNHYISCLILSIYFRRIYGDLFTPKNLIIYAMISIGLESIIGLIQQITGTEFGNIQAYVGETPETTELRSIGDTDMGRVHGTLGTGNLVGNWIVMFLPFILYGKYYIKNKYYMIWKNIIVILSLIAVFLTISRFSITLYLGILFFPYFINITKIIKTKINTKYTVPNFVYSLIMSLILISSTIIFWDSVLMMKEAVEFRFSDTFEEASEIGEGSSGVAARMEMNKGALQAFIQSPIIGVGFKNSRWIWPKVDADVPSNWVYQPHNLYMIMLVEGGIFLFLAYLIYTLLPFYKIWQLRKSKDPFIIAFFLSLSVCIGIQSIYITFTSPVFAGVYTMIMGCAMGHFDQELDKKKGNHE